MAIAEDEQNPICPDQIQDVPHPTLLRRRWLRIMPAMFVTYSLAYLVRASYGFGAAAGMADTLHITGRQSSLLGALFFLGYFVFQVPAAAYAQQRGASRLVFAALLLWGTMASLTGIVRSFWVLAWIRFLLGAAESLIVPAMLVLLTKWFTRSERSRANTILLLGNPVTVLWMSALTGYLILRVGWQMTFILEGLPSLGWAFFWIWIVDDHPDGVKWLDQESKQALASSLEQEQLLLAPVSGMKQVLRKPAVILLCLQYFFWSIGVYGFVLWLPSIIQTGAARGIGITGLLSAVPYLFAVIAMVLVGYLSDASGRRKRFIWPSMIIAGAALYLSHLTVGNHFWVAYVALVLAGACMYAPYGPFFAIIPEMLPSSVAGEAMGLINSFGAVGGFAGSYIIGLLQSSRGGSSASFLAMSISLLIAGLIILAIGNSTSQSTVFSRSSSSEPSLVLTCSDATSTRHAGGGPNRIDPIPAGNPKGDSL
jgi:sugar phosphate permease